MLDPLTETSSIRPTDGSSPAFVSQLMSDAASPKLGEYEFFDFKPASVDIAQEVLAGLAESPKRVSPKYFYDETGSKLFEQITQLDEYYLTRTEMALFDLHLQEVAQLVEGDVCLIEYGSGSSLKIRKVLEAFTPTAYVPVDISGEHLQQNARGLQADFPGLNVYPVCTDFTQAFELPEPVTDMVKVGFFPGSSIGNFDPHHAQDFLSNVRQAVGLGGALILGADRKKDPAILELAYDDPGGVTAAFNLNMLTHLNRLLGADFDTSKFAHVARYNTQLGCIQMFLQAREDHSVAVAGQEFSFTKGEAIHSENSYKYDPEEVRALAQSAGFVVDQLWSDAKDWFSLYLLRGV